MHSMFWVFVMLVAFAPETRAEMPPARPIVFIPGLLGTKLCGSDGKIIWGDRASLLNFEQLTLAFDADPAQLEHRPCGLIGSIQIVGPFRIHQYDGLFSYLNELRFIPGGAIHVFPYDWRLSNFDSAQKLRDFIEASFPDPAQKVDIVAHSMGGLVARIYLQELGGDRRVDRIVMMGTPHRGSGQVFKTLEEGWNWWQDALAGGLPAIRETLLSFPSVYQLLPSYQNCCGWREKNYAPLQGQFSAFDEIAWRKFGWLPARFRTPEGQRFLASALEEGKRLSMLMQDKIPRSVRHANIVTGLITTQSKSYFNPQTGLFTGQDGYPGDGTVIEWSAANGAPSEAKPAHDQHQTIFDGPGARTALRWLLNDDVEPRSGLITGFRGNLKDARGHTVDLASIEYEATPQILKPGAAGTIALRLRGKAALADADLSNIRMVLGDGATAMLLTATVSSAVPSDDGIERIVSASFAAPSEFGVYSIGTDIPGVATYDEYIVVVK